MSDNKPQSAFPHLVPHNPDFAYSASGMTLRDYFAGQAIIAWMADGTCSDVNGCARTAYDIADAMLAVRGEK